VGVCPRLRLRARTPRALADFLNYCNHERPHSALGSQPPISRTTGSEYRVSFDQPREPINTFPEQLTFEDFV
jgi:transposase InsO family protein